MEVMFIQAARACVCISQCGELLQSFTAMKNTLSFVTLHSINREEITSSSHNTDKLVIMRTYFLPII